MMTKKPQIMAIWAQAENGVIGKQHGMPWHLPAELKHFKETTMGQVILMGRVTFDGMNQRVLPGRETLILSRDKNYVAEGVTVFSSVEEVMTWFKGQDKDLYIAGGAGIYSLFEPYYDQLIQTVICADIDGDTYFPEIDWSAYHLQSEKHYQKDDNNEFEFTVRYFERKG